MQLFDAAVLAHLFAEGFACWAFAALALASGAAVLAAIIFMFGGAASSSFSTPA
jgi:hypothetical protein